MAAATNDKTRKTGQLPLKLRAGGKTDVRTQFGALCWRVKAGKLQVCLVTTRQSGRWIIPRGWPQHKQTPAASAATEAWEEAGLRGQPIDYCLGAYTYVKPLKNRAAPVIVMVYPLRVTESSGVWPESHQRKRKWMRPAKAAKRVDEPGLRRILMAFDPERVPH